MDDVWWDFRGEEKKGGAESEPATAELKTMQMCKCKKHCNSDFPHGENTVCFQVPQGIHNAFPMAVCDVDPTVHWVSIVVQRPKCPLL
jgi:hypothetical protein